MAAFPLISETNYFLNHGNLFNLLLQTNPDDNQLRFMGWENLKQRAPIGPLNIPKMMQALEKQFLKNGNPLVDNVHQLFARFTELLTSEIQLTRLPGEVFQVTEADLITLQTRLQKHYEDQALETIWNQSLVGIFNQQGAFQHVAPLNEVEQIRAWLNDPANMERIQQVTRLDLSYSRLKALPFEIGLFTGLQQLCLSDNQLSYLPESLGNLQALRWLYLWNNELSYLPESLGNLQALRRLDLDNNRLSYLPESLGNLRALTEFNLSNNQLSYLPESLGNLRALTDLFLYKNQLSYLPESLDNLQALRRLDLSNNQLSSLPVSLGNLQALRRLDLSNNQLSSLPESLGNLQGLTGLYLSNNQLSYLPEFLGNLRALNSVSLDHNPLMLVSDEERDKIKSCRTYLALLELVKKYTPQSPLATLFHAIIFNKPTETIQQAYAQLSPEMQQRIAELAAQDPTNPGSAQSTAASSSASSSSSDPSPSQSSLFTDMGLFARSVRKATYGLYDSLSLDQRNLVHYHIWDLAGRPETDNPQWGEHHASDHVIRFTDALERATQS
ncbi:MAG: leucine-rich repeat domain-containing protein [Parachlamydiales bacterium]|nr:leucine-rich repeat domain-containing protein [Candidatus Acheromyda pituitae]